MDVIYLPRKERVSYVVPFVSTMLNLCSNFIVSECMQYNFIMDCVNMILIIIIKLYVKGYKHKSE